MIRRTLSVDRNRAARCARALAWFAAAALSACQPRAPQTPEAQASAFIEAYVAVTRDPAVLRQMINDPAREAEELARETPARIAIDYLRAKARQGTVWQASATLATQTGARSRVVTVQVREREPAASPADVVTLRVLLEQHDDGSWRIAHLSAGD